MSHQNNNLSGKSARIANIRALTQRILAIIQNGDRTYIERHGRVLAGLVESFLKKHPLDHVPEQVSAAQVLVKQLRASGYTLPTKREKRIQKKMHQREELITRRIDSMVRRTATSTPKPKGEPHIIYTPFEADRAKH